jgi:16S rRNA (adenine1518-N6/adenine1519-N6)-dimethyltransferase
LEETKRALSLHQLPARKRKGQYFLINHAIREKIIAAAELSPKDVVVEVGSGTGTLTERLAQSAGRILAIEQDKKLCRILSRNMSPYLHVEVIAADILTLDLARILGDEEYKVVGNLPYYITSPTLRLFLECKRPPQMMVIMVQKEVAKAIVERKTSLSLEVELYAKASIVSYVERKDFLPPPKVESAILRLDLLAPPLVELSEREDFMATVRASFFAPRKQLKNSLSHGLGLSPEIVKELLRRSSVSPHLRPSELTLKDWIRIYRVLKNADGKGLC